MEIHTLIHALDYKWKKILQSLVIGLVFILDSSAFKTKMIKTHNIYLLSDSIKLYNIYIYGYGLGYG